MADRMSKKTWLILAIVIIAVGAIIGIALSRNSSSPPDSTPQPQEALNFILPTMTGANITLSELEGTPLVVNFWSISCSWCRYQLPFLEAVAQQSEGELKVIAINIGDSASGIRSFFGDYEPAMIVALDSNREAFVDYCLAYNNTRGAIPFTLFVDSDGVIQYVKLGAFSSEEVLWNALHDVLAIAIPETS